MLQLRKQQQQIAAQRAAVAAAAAGVPNAGGDGNPGAVQSSPPGGPDPMAAQTGGQPTGQSSEVQNVGPGRGSWEYVDEIVQILKTAFPLLVLSLETVVDQIAKRFKTSGDEEQYRILCVLTNDAIQVSFVFCCQI
jgi:transformation/transcription domain-associated protein